jgi:hypothetical protein
MSTSRSNDHNKQSRRTISFSTDRTDEDGYIVNYRLVFIRAYSTHSCTKRSVWCALKLEVTWL